MCTASLMFSPPSSASMALLVASTPRLEPTRGQLASEEERQDTRPSFTQYQTPRRTPATSLILRSITPSSHPRPSYLSGNKRQALLSGSPRLEIKPTELFDVLICLPVEVSVLILEYLRPKDLCQVCLVSRDWYRLSQHPPLLKQRRCYVKALREDYQLSKENYPNPNLRDNDTPQQPTSFTVTSRQMTVGQSPLNVIQPRIKLNRSSGQRVMHTTPSQMAPSPQQGLGQTPCPAYLLEDVRKLSLDDGGAEVRRCLFPVAEATVSPPHSHKACMQHTAARQAWNLQQRNGYKSSSTKSEFMAGKKANRSRLRRL